MSKDQSNHRVLSQRITDHEKLCRIMQKQTHARIASIKKQIERLEKIVISSAAFVIIGLFTIVFALIKFHF
jgi:uncharacterized membrane protein YvbJ